MKKSSIIIIEGDILKGKTHVLYGLTTGLALGMNLPQLTVLTLGALLPDIDHEKSAIGHYIPIISKHSHHRGFYHSALFAALCFVLSPYLGIGVLSHIVLDMFNVVGVELLCALHLEYGSTEYSKDFLTDAKLSNTDKIIVLRNKYKYG